MITAIVFDLDNTLLDFYKVKQASCEAAIDAMIDAGLEMNRKQALKLLFELYEKYGIEYKEIFQRFLKKAIGRVDWKLLASGIVAYRKIKSGFLQTYPGVESTLIQLKARGIELAILTDAPRMNAYIRLASLKLLEFFDYVLTYDDTRAHKPARKVFRAMLKKLDVEPGQVLMVGDWPERDMKGAREAGMLTCFARYGAIRHYKSVDSDYSIRKFKDLIKIIDKANR